MARTGGREVALPIWFLAVYLLTVAAAPPLLAAHQRYGVRLLVALAAGAATVDVPPPEVERIEPELVGGQIEEPFAGEGPLVATRAAAGPAQGSHA
jgi:hypothetical protein